MIKDNRVIPEKIINAFENNSKRENICLNHLREKEVRKNTKL